MNIFETRKKVALFSENLPDVVWKKLRDAKIDIAITLGNICDAHTLVIYETGNIFDGVFKILTGAESPNSFLASVQKDPNIEDDNRAKIPALAYEIQQKIFDIVLPILKTAGMPVKEGKVPPPPVAVASPYAPTPSPLGQIRPIRQIEEKTPLQGTSAPASKMPAGSPLVPPATDSPLSASHIRALTRIASGTNHSEDALRRAFEKLPQGLRQAVSSVDTANAIQDIAKKYLLHVDQMAHLASETGLVLLGLTHPANYTQNLTKRLRIPESSAKEIAREISVAIFAKIRDALRGLHERTENKIPQESAAPKGPTPVPPANVMPPRKLLAPSEQARVQPASSSTVKTTPRSTTPYSPQAKWDTGAVASSRFAVPDSGNRPQKTENILERQARMKENLIRQEILRDIENPSDTPLPQGTPPPARPSVTPAEWQRPVPKPPAPPPRPAPTAIPRPPVLPVPYPSRASSPMPPAPRTEMKPPVPPPVKIRPKSEDGEVGYVPPTGESGEKRDLLDEKLAGPMSIPAETRTYTTDPYREPTE